MSVSGRAAPLPPRQRRDQILDCALAVFAHKGLHETSIADICVRARIGRGTLYQYFTDKRAVLAALIERIVGRIIEAVQHWPRFALPPDGKWGAEHNVAFVEGRCLQLCCNGTPEALKTAHFALGLAAQSATDHARARG